MKALKLLIAAATLAVSVSTTQAAVYSQNVVGYVNISIPAGKYQMVANQLDTGSNYLNNIFPTGVSGVTSLLKFSSGAFVQYVWQSSDDSNDGLAGWHDTVGAGNLSTNVLLNPGEGCFIHNSDVNPLNLTTLGSVVSGTNVSSIPTGYSMHSYTAPIGGQTLDTQGYVGSSGNDSILRFNGTSYVQIVYQSSDDSNDGLAGWHDTTGAGNLATNANSWPAAGESFFISHSGSGITWTNVFNLPQ